MRVTNKKYIRGYEKEPEIVEDVSEIALQIGNYVQYTISENKDGSINIRKFGMDISVFPKADNVIKIV